MQLAQHRKAWSATRAEGMLDGLPPAIANRIEAILSQIDASEAALGMALERQFALMRRASELKARIQAGRRNVDAAIDDIDSRLLAIDAEPLWHGAGQRTEAAAVRHGLEIEEQFAIDYHAVGTGNQQALRLTQLLLLPLLLWLYLRSRGTQPMEENLGKPLPALHRPVAVWLLLSMLAVLLLEPDAPLLVHEVALVLAVVPVLRLLPSGMLRALGAWPYFAAGLYVLDRLCVAAVSDASWYRLLLLVLGFLAIGLTAWMLRLKPAPASAAGGRLRWMVRHIALLVLAVLAVAVIANLLGNVSLAEMLTSGVIDSGYMALLLYCAVHACVGIVRVLLSQPELAHRGFVRHHEAALQQMSTRLLVLAAILGWLLYSADRFRLLRPLQHAGATLMGLGVEVGEVSVHLGDVLVFGLASWLAVGVARAVRRVLRDGLPGRKALPRGVGNSIASLSYYGVLALGLLVALSAAGFKVSQLMLVFGALGVGIGFGLQNVVNNFVSGLVLMFERPIQPGDVVDAAGSSGTVKEIRLRSTTIRTFDGADVVVPNGVLLSGNLTNWTMHDHHRRVDITVGVDFGADPARVLALLGGVARGTPGVAEQPAPIVLMTEIGESALSFTVRVWTHDISNWLELRSELLARTMAGLREAGIAIPYNQLAVHLRPVPGQADAAG
jgi:small-conductance mechanosensitive channel